jgi:hypothetical protein
LSSIQTCFDINFWRANGWTDEKNARSEKFHRKVPFRSQGELTVLSTPSVSKNPMMSTNGAASKFEEERKVIK